MITKLTDHVKKVLNKMFHQAELPEEPKVKTKPYRLSDDGGKIYRISLDFGETYGDITVYDTAKINIDPSVVVKVYGGEPHPVKKSLITRLMDRLQTLIKSK